MTYQEIQDLKLNPNLDSLLLGCLSFDDSFEFYRGKCNGYYHLLFGDYVPGVVISILCSKYSCIKDFSLFESKFDVTLIFVPEL